MARIHSRSATDNAGEFEILNLELCPQPVQVMPPEASRREIPLALAVFGNTLIGALLLGGLLLMPSLFASLVNLF